jgi:hypothetical protein
VIWGAAPVRAWRALAWAAPVLLYAALWLGTLQHVAPSGDAASTWASRHPTRTVLCVAPSATGEPRLTLAAAPDPEDRAAVAATLDSTEVAWGTEAAGLVFRDHTYRASVRVLGAEWPWMINAYSGGFSDWLEHAGYLATDSVRGGFAATALLGLLALVLTMAAARGLAGAEHAPFAGLVAGLALASEPTFHLWKRVGTGREVWLQIAAVGALLALAQAWRRRSVGLGLLGCALIGLGLHDKLSFLGPALALGIGVLVTLGRGAWRPGLRARTLGGLLAGALAAAVVLTPTVAYWVLVPEMPRMGRQDGLATNLASVGARLTGERHVPEPRGPDPRGAPAPDRTGPDPKARIGLGALLLRPTAFWQAYWTLHAEPRPTDPEAPVPPEPIRARTRWALLLATGLAALGVVGAPRRQTLRVAGGVAVLQFVFLRALSGDPHHVAMGLPIAAAVVGAGLARWAGRGPWAQGTALALALGVAAGGAWDLAGLDAALTTRAGRLLDARSLVAMASRLEADGVGAPAVLDYEMMSLLEAYSADAVRPFFYGRAERGWGRCLDREDPRWLAQVLRAHAGGHLLVVRERRRPESRLEPDVLAGPERRAQAAALAGVTLSEDAVFRDSVGRWYATLWGVHPGR